MTNMHTLKVGWPSLHFYDLTARQHFREDLILIRFFDTFFFIIAWRGVWFAKA